MIALVFVVCMMNLFLAVDNYIVLHSIRDDINFLIAASQLGVLSDGKKELEKNIDESI